MIEYQSPPFPPSQPSSFFFSPVYTVGDSYQTLARAAPLDMPETCKTRLCGRHVPQACHANMLLVSMRILRQFPVQFIGLPQHIGLLSLAPSFERIMRCRFVFHRRISISNHLADRTW
jgi:hypothetical protein